MNKTTQKKPVGNQTALVINNGIAEEDGIYAPSAKGELNLKEKRSFKKNEVFPDKRKWILIGPSY